MDDRMARTVQNKATASVQDAENDPETTSAKKRREEPMRNLTTYLKQSCDPSSHSLYEGI